MRTYPHNRTSTGRTGARAAPLSGRMSRLILHGSLLILFLAAIAPVQAGTLYQDGTPRLFAYISGSNEFNPGDEGNFTVTVKNTGLNSIKIVQASVSTRDDLPNTAKFVTVTLHNGNAPLAVKSDSQVIGDLVGGSEGNVSFFIRIDPKSPAGVYDLPLDYSYQYLSYADTYDNGTIKYTYLSANGTLTVPITIKPVVVIEVLSAVPDNLNAGTLGYVDLKIRNAGSDFGRKAVVRLLRSGSSAIIPNDSSVYIGDFPPGGIAECRYRISAIPNAQAQRYPVDVLVMYQNEEGDFVNSQIDTVGVPVGNKADFAVISDPVVMFPGTKRIIAVTYRNTGGVPVYSASARIIAEIPFTTSDDIAELGDIMPGDSATANFGLTVDRTATIKDYGLDSEVRYRDSLNTSYVSDVVPVRIAVEETPGFTTILTNPVYLTIVVIALFALAYFLFRSGRKIMQKYFKGS